MTNVLSDSFVACILDKWFGAAAVSGSVDGSAEAEARGPSSAGTTFVSLAGFGAVRAEATKSVLADFFALHTIHTTGEARKEEFSRWCTTSHRDRHSHHPKA